ncbi:MAG: lytic transglycosylase domain-containing protein [Sutterellaceae bacterium]|nr:lytic transglycosylase domain-containing protein [Sutterellaceae bacterium]
MRNDKHGTLLRAGILASVLGTVSAASLATPWGPVIGKCAPGVARDTIEAIVRAESSGNPFAVGIVGGKASRQPKSLPEAVSLGKSLDRAGVSWSAGLAQVNRANFARLGLTTEAAFDPCLNVSGGARILSECWARTSPGSSASDRLRTALSCYYAGPSGGPQPGYVKRILAASGSPG